MSSKQEAQQAAMALVTAANVGDQEAIAELGDALATDPQDAAVALLTLARACGLLAGELAVVTGRELAEVWQEHALAWSTIDDRRAGS
ncbi:MAG: hypothetical protein ACRDZ0_09490 [Acidimicrobiales bacterium]